MTAGVAFAGMALLLAGSRGDAPFVPPRAEAAAFVVTSLADSGPGTLRQAIINANAAPGFDVITFGVSGTILLALPLSVTDPAGLLIDGSSQSVTLDGGHRTWMLHIAPGAKASVTALSFTRSNHSAVYNQGSLVLWNSTFTYGSAGGGAALFNPCGAVAEVRDSTFSDNVADNSGGAIYNEGLLSVVGSTLTSNSAGLGGALFNQRSTSPNCWGQASIANSTISDNAALRGGAIANYGGHAALINSTVYENAASITGGGLYSQLAGDFALRNSILTRNTALDAPNCSGPVTTGSHPNLSNDLSGCSVIGAAPIVASEALNPLADNGGPTKTHSLQLGSKALSTGDPAVCSTAPVSGKDQRGVARPIGSGCELGAVEAEVVGGRGFSVFTDKESGVALRWNGGNAQAGYSILRHNVLSGVTELLPPQAGASTGYDDTGVIDGQAYCYVLLPTDDNAVLGTSDLLCVLAGTRVVHMPFNAAGDLRVRLNEGNTATLEYKASILGAESFRLIIVPMDGSSPQVRPLPGHGVVLFPVIETHDTNGAGFCYDMVALRVESTSNPDIICAIPGFSTLASPAKAEAGAAPGGKARAGVPPKQKQTIESVTKRMQERLAPLAGQAAEVRQRAEAAAGKTVPGAGKQR